MKVVILAGGYGTRISEETRFKPKPMVEIGGRPLLWHVMKVYSRYNLFDFIICLGYKGYYIKEYFVNYVLHQSDLTVDCAKNQIDIHHKNCEPWRITLVDTGQDTMTGGRLKKVAKYIGEDDFCFTYGDGVADIDIVKLVNFHKKHGKYATMTTVLPPNRYGAVTIDGEIVKSFAEKPVNGGGWINGGFFVLSPRVMSYIEGDETIWERDPLERLSSDGQMCAYRHSGFWYAVDTLRDKNYLDNLISQGDAPWLRPMDNGN